MWLQIKKKLDSLLDYYSETSLNQTIGANWLDDFDSFNKKPFVNKVIAKNNPNHFYSEGPQLEQIDLLILIVLT
jgi:hypothetical protein